MSHNALNAESIKTANDLKTIRNDYASQIQSRIEIAKIHRDANTLYEYNGMLPHYKQNFESIEEQFADVNALKASLIK